MGAMAELGFGVCSRDGPGGTRGTASGCCGGRLWVLGPSNPVPGCCRGTWSQVWGCCRGTQSQVLGFWGAWSRALGCSGGRRQVWGFMEAGAKLWGAAGPRDRFWSAEGDVEQGFGVLEVYAVQF